MKKHSMEKDKILGEIMEEIGTTFKGLIDKRKDLEGRLLTGQRAISVERSKLDDLQKRALQNLEDLNHSSEIDDVTKFSLQKFKIAAEIRNLEELVSDLERRLVVPVEKDLTSIKAELGAAVHESLYKWWERYNENLSKFVYECLEPKLEVVPSIVDTVAREFGFIAGDRICRAEFFSPITKVACDNRHDALMAIWQKYHADPLHAGVATSAQEAFPGPGTKEMPAMEPLNRFGVGHTVFAASSTAILR